MSILQDIGIQHIPWRLFIGLELAMPLFMIHFFLKSGLTNKLIAIFFALLIYYTVKGYMEAFV
jgi:hypothetical protein